MQGYEPAARAQDFRGVDISNPKYVFTEGAEHPSLRVPSSVGILGDDRSIQKVSQTAAAVAPLTESPEVSGRHDSVAGLMEHGDVGQCPRDHVFQRGLEIWVLGRECLSGQGGCIRVDFNADRPVAKPYGLAEGGPAASEGVYNQGVRFALHGELHHPGGNGCEPAGPPLSCVVERLGQVTAVALPKDRIKDQSGSFPASPEP